MGVCESIPWLELEGEYWSPEKGQQYKLVLAFWRAEKRSYDEGKTEKTVIVFDVLKVDNHEIIEGQRKFVTGAQSFASEVRPIIEKAERNNKQAIHVLLKYSKEKRYSLWDLSEVQ